jgi:hypothetical protein
MGWGWQGRMRWIAVTIDNIHEYVVVLRADD